ncbi:uncharacterized protein B0P05DRAFT_520855 [Gilbertella persicaria]|uniref:uncharacterized protein n=1 Tax=Gilbertella persicaria TaxID=101096 RepID=UPI00221ED30D|nr:uncharacterized protein B0P05DRAFT_520855 [Gilbertella persicaria]KAI8098195.1 hypothetical protein B0P05DRAFT_520855 [Gilbertella persicaria]
MNNFPTEVYLRIFYFVPRTTLLSCLYVCKLWHLHATKALYREITLTGPSQKDFLSFLKETKLGPCIEKLTLYHGRNEPRKYEWTEQELKDIMLRLPCLRTLIFSTNDRQVWYLLNLLKMDKQQLKYLSRVDISRDHHHDPIIMGLYVSVNQWLSDTITHLTLDHLQLEDYFGSSTYRIACFLSEFHQLSHLKIVNDFLSGTSRLDMIRVLCACPKLEHFYLSSQYHLIETDEMEWTPLPCLKELTLILPDLPDSYVDYMVHTIPFKKLKKCAITLTDTKFLRWIYQHTDAFIDRFTDRFSQCKHFDLLMKNTGLPNREESIQLPSNNQAMTKVWQFIDKLRANRQFVTHVSASFQDSLRTSRFFEPTICIRDHRTLSLNWLYLPYSNSLSSYFNRHSIALHTLHILCLGLCDSMALLTHVLEHCPTLNMVWIEHTHNSSILLGPVVYHSNPSSNKDYFEKHKDHHQQASIAFASLEHIHITHPFKHYLKTLPFLQHIRYHACQFEPYPKRKLRFNLQCIK